MKKTPKDWQAAINLNRENERRENEQRLAQSVSTGQPQYEIPNDNISLGTPFTLVFITAIIAIAGLCTLTQ